MDPYAIVLGIVCGICLGTGIFHVFIGLLRRGYDVKHVLFGLFAVSYGCAVLTGLLMYRATTLPQYRAFDAWTGLAAGLTYILLIWFVAVYTRVRPVPFLIGLTALFAIVVTAHLARPTGIHGEFAGLVTLTLPWGEQLAFLDAGDSPWVLAFLLAQLLTIGFVLTACVRQYRRGERRAALALGTGLLFFVATLVLDFFAESGTVPFVVASDFGFLPLAVAMSLQISEQIIRTEEDLAHHRENLEMLVEQRTAELVRTNEELTREMGERERVAQVLAVSEERSRIARDLHDSVTQTIYSASLIAEALPRVWERQPGQVPGNLTTLLRLIRGALAEMRTLLFELRPAALEEASLGRLLHQLANVLTGRTQIPVEVTVQGGHDLPVETKIALYRIAQEAFNNIAKHADATQVAATLQHLPGRIRLTIEDDGRGFDPDAGPADRMGLRILQERAERIGAELTIDSAVGQGTRVAVVWALTEELETTAAEGVYP